VTAGSGLTRARAPWFFSGTPWRDGGLGLDAGLGTLAFLGHAVA